MRKLCVALFLFAASIVFTAVWFSPLVGIGKAEAYSDNVAVGELSGVCYPRDALVRVELAGGESELNVALEKISAAPIKRVESDGLVIVYACSDRVCAKEQTLSDGRSYNVMAATDGEHVYIGTPILSGCY